MDRIQSNETIHELDWWIEILTAQPLCLYYFGSFMTHQEAESLKQGFIEDLLLENALIMATDIRFFRPQQLTLVAEEVQLKIPSAKRIPMKNTKSNFKGNSKSIVIETLLFDSAI